MIRGIDISSYQGDIDFAAVKASGVGFVYAKATQGIGYIDDHYATYHDACKAYGIPFGAYHFLSTQTDPAEQAKHFLTTIAGREGELLPMIDVELAVGTPATMVARIAAFMAAVEGTLHGKKMLLYTYLSFWNTAMNGASDFSGHPLWVAEYNGDPAPTLPAGFRSWTIWQHASIGRVPGIKGDVDLDRLNGDDLSVISR